MKIIVINAAPRMESGNTQVMLNPFLVGMRSQGAEVDIALLARKKIKPCIGCFTCYAKTPGVCIHADDMPALVERVRRADLMVLATPVYLDGMTSLAKIFMDRLVVFLDPHFLADGGRLHHPLRWRFPEKMFLVSVCGYPGLENFQPLQFHMERIARNMHADFCGSLLRPAAFSVLLAKKYPDRVREVIDAARIAGEELVKSGAVREDILKAAAADICSTEELMKSANAFWDRELATRGDEPA
jgi:putative NADPH-quinone reductase